MPSKNQSGCKCCAPVLCSGTTRICVTVTDGCGSPGNVYGATVTVKKAGSTVGTCTTNASGQCCVTVTLSGAYTVEVSLPGATTITQTVSVTCNIDNNVSMAFNPTTNPVGRVDMSAVYCDGVSGNNNYAGCTIAIGGVTATTGGGTATLWVGPGTYTATLTSPGGYSGTRSVTVTGCTSTSVSLSIINGMGGSVFGTCSVTFTLALTGGAMLGTTTVTGPADWVMTFADTLINTFVDFTSHQGIHTSTVTEQLTCITKNSPNNYTCF